MKRSMTQCHVNIVRRKLPELKWCLTLWFSIFLKMKALTVNICLVSAFCIGGIEMYLSDVRIDVAQTRP